MRRIGMHLLIAVTALVAGCQSWLIDAADRGAYGLIDQRQRASLGTVHDARIGAEDGRLTGGDLMYSFSPHPLEATLPESFQTTRPPSTGAAEPVEPPAEQDHAPGDNEGSEAPSVLPDTKERPPHANGERSPERPLEREGPTGQEQEAESEAQPPTAVRDQGATSREDQPGENGEDQSRTSRQLTESIFSADEVDRVTRMSLQDALAYAMRHARDLQDAKEDLYLAALDLTLERHLWTPLFSASVQVNRERFQADDPLDHALTTVSDVAVRQRLPLGGELTARVVQSLVRDVSDLVSKGESGQVILNAQIPLLRGAGRVNYESRFQAERNLIFAVRRYERFRRTFLVDIAADYFNLQQDKAEIANTYKSYLSRKLLSEKADFVHRMGRSENIRDAPRAKANLRRAEADLVSTKERYETALDRFKIRLAMPVDTLLDVVNQGEDQGSKAVDDMLPDVASEEAVEVAIHYRLDLLNSLDRLDDVRRGVVIAKNRVLPDLDFTARLTADTDPNQLRTTQFSDRRVSWQGGLEFRLDDRWVERNAYRTTLVSRRRAERDYGEFRDRVRADVRRALRRVAQQEELRLIQEFNVKENAFRLDGARAQVDLGRADNQDVVDAENELLTAENQLAAAVAAYRVAVLEFRRDTGTLRITDDGRWGVDRFQSREQKTEPHADDDG